MNTKSGIYKLEFPGGEIYIGQSINLDNRLATHTREMQQNIHPNYKIRECITKYGNLPDISILREYSPEELNEAEIFWVEHFDSFKNGLNLTKGGGAKSGQGRSDQYVNMVEIAKDNIRAEVRPDGSFTNIQFPDPNETREIKTIRARAFLSKRSLTKEEKEKIEQIKKENTKWNIGIIIIIIILIIGILGVLIK